MKYTDIVFGEVTIDEPVIIDIINSDAFQRLKKIDQAGYAEPYFPNTKHTRYQHSINDYLLLNKYNARIEEQIIGLIHDMSHLSFSHCIDYVLNEQDAGKQIHQDNIFEDYIINRTDIPKILKKYGHDINYILDETNFPLQEKNIPDLCADRISYSLLGAVIYRIYSQTDLNSLLNNLKIIDNEWVFTSLQSAKQYAELFQRLNDEHYTGVATASMFLGLRDYLKYAMQKKYINEEDFYINDQHVIDKINIHLPSENELQTLWYRVNNSDWCKSDDKDYDEKIVCKSRVVDPLVLTDNVLKRVSELDDAWKKIVSEGLKPKTHYLKILK